MFLAPSVFWGTASLLLCTITSGSRAIPPEKQDALFKDLKEDWKIGFNVDPDFLTTLIFRALILGGVYESGVYIRVHCLSTLHLNRPVAQMP